MKPRSLYHANNTLRVEQQLQELHDAVSKARITQEHDPTDTNVENHNKVRAEFTRHKLHQTRTAWHKRLHPSIWKRTLQNSGYSSSCLTKITQRSGKQSLSHRTSTWHNREPQTVSPTCTKRRAQWNSPEKEQGMSEIKFLKNHTCWRMHDWCHPDGWTRSGNQNVKNKKAPEPDGVTNDMILHLGMQPRKPLCLFLTNPGSQRRFSSVEKGHNNPYLQERKRQETSRQLQTNQPFKLPRKATGTYLKYKIDGPTHSGYRKHRSTEDQLALLVTRNRECLQGKEKDCGGILRPI